MKYALLLVLAACTETHTPAQVEITQNSCELCHSGNLIHPEDAFPLMSMNTKHTDIACEDCHHFDRGLGITGVHADCTSCHFQADIDPTHTGIDGYMFDKTNHDFCMNCHPMGLQ